MLDHILDTVYPNAPGDWNDATEFTEALTLRRFRCPGYLCVIRPMPRRPVVLNVQYEIDGYTIVSIDDRENGYMEIVYRHQEPPHA